jgi:Cu+-exporting ATPase
MVLAQRIGTRREIARLDAPALAQAHVGIAMGTGADVAMECAAVTLIKGDLQGIVRARRLSRATMRNIRQNPFLRVRLQCARGADRGRRALSFHCHPANPMIASAAMSMSSVLVVTNALRLRAIRL